MKRTFAIATLIVFAVALQSEARPLVRELFDNVTNATSSLAGLKGGTTSFGFNSAGVWNASPVNNIFQLISGDEIDDWKLGVYPNLPANAGASAAMGMAVNSANGWNSASYAYRALDVGSRINLNVAGTYYFSVRLMKRGLWWVNTEGTITNNYGYDDTALGVGFLQGAAVNTNTSFFVGAGFTRSVAANGGGGYLTEDGSTDLGDRVYITTGTLGQPGYTNHPGDSGGPYYVRAYGLQQQITGYLSGFPDMSGAYVNGGWLVGKLTTTVGGSSTISVKAYVAADLVDATEPGSWDTTYNFTNTSTLFYLMAWMHGNNNANPCFIDAIRVATTWSEAVGLEALPVTVSPTNTFYEGTPVTLSATAGWRQDDQYIFAERYQWLKNGTNIPGAEGVGGTIAYTNSSPVPADSGSYSLVFSNDFNGGGLLVTSPPVTLTVLGAIPPFFVLQPASVNRYQGAPSATFTVTPDGAFPFTYQWKKVSGGATNTLTDQTNKTLILTNIQPSDIAGYFVTVGNFVGSSNSAVATLSIVVPKPGSFEDAVVDAGPHAYWKMQETNGTVLHDYWGGYDGTVLDPAYLAYTVDTNTMTTNTYVAGVSLGVAGAQAAGFPGNHTAVQIPINGLRARVDMPPLPILSNSMTFVCWLYSPSPTAPGNGFIMQRDRSGTALGASGYGVANGLMFTPNVSGGTTNYNQLGYQWGGGDVNPGAAFLGYQWTNSGLYLPTTSWTFVTLVVETNKAYIYMGTNGGPLSVASTTLPTTLPSSVDANFPGTVYSNNWPLVIGRHGWPWADDGESNAWANANVSISDVAVFYSPLSSVSITNLYAAAVGQVVTFTNSGPNLVLSWPLGALQSATVVTGLYTNVVGATSPFNAPKTGTQRFFRAQQ